MDRLRVAARKRRPHLAISCVVAGLAFSPAGAWPVLAATTLALVFGGWSFGRRGAVFGAALVLGAALVGGLRTHAIDAPAAAAPPGSVIDAEATLLERPRAGLFGTAAPMRIETGPARGLRVFARYDRTWPSLDPGARFRMRAFVRMPRIASPTGAVP